MRYILLLLIIFGYVSPLYAQAIESKNPELCAPLEYYLRAASSLWYLDKPGNITPFTNAKFCKNMSDATSMCMSIPSNIEQAKNDAALWLRTLNTCLGTKGTAKGIQRINIAGATHDVIELEPLAYRGQTLKMNVRIQFNKNDTQANAAWLLEIQSATQNSPNQKICMMINDLLDSKNIQNNWQAWQGPLDEKWDGTSYYTCAKVPFEAASRYDCELAVEPNKLLWSARWTYAANQIEQIQKYAQTISSTIATCTPGLVYTPGKMRHLIEYPKNKVTMTIQASKNDVGRGPSITLKVQH